MTGEGSEINLNEAKFYADEGGSNDFLKEVTLAATEGSRIDFVSTTFTAETKGSIDLASATFTAETKGSIDFLQSTFTASAGSSIRFLRSTFTASAGSWIGFTEVTFLASGQGNWIRFPCAKFDGTGEVSFADPREWVNVSFPWDQDPTAKPAVIRPIDWPPIPLHARLLGGGITNSVG